MDDDVRRLAGTMDELTSGVRGLRAERDALARRVDALETELEDVRGRAKKLIAALTVQLVTAGSLKPEEIEAARAAVEAEARGQEPDPVDADAAPEAAPSPELDTARAIDEPALAREIPDDPTPARSALSS